MLTGVEAAMASVAGAVLGIDLDVALEEHKFFEKDAASSMESDDLLDENILVDNVFMGFSDPLFDNKDFYGVHGVLVLLPRPFWPAGRFSIFSTYFRSKSGKIWKVFWNFFLYGCRQPGHAGVSDEC
jgi:hypothetical protein